MDGTAVWLGGAVWRFSASLNTVLIQMFGVLNVWGALFWCTYNTTFSQHWGQA
jgi:hypothetical protein